MLHAASNVPQAALQRFWWQCGRKRRYSTWHEAAEHSKQLQQKKGVVYNVYECEYCKGFHVGKLNWRRKQTMRRTGEL
jgi:hypothetical protein